MTAISRPVTTNLRATTDRFVPTEKRNLIGVACFIALICTTILDVNQLIWRLTNVSQALSYLILAACVLGWLAFRLGFGRSLSLSGWYYVLFIVVGYVGFGSLLKMGKAESNLIFVLVYLWRLNIVSLVILLTAALGARHLLLRYGVERAMGIVFYLSMVGVGMILLDFATGGRLLTNRHDENQKLLEMAGRAGGLWANPNQAGYAACLTSTLGFGLLTARKNRLFVLAMLAATGIATITTFSRSSILIFFGIICGQAVFSPVIKNKLNFILSSVIAVAFAWAVLVGFQESFVLNHHQRERLQSITHISKGTADEADIGHRGKVGGLAMQYWAKSPILGHGLGAATYTETNPELELGPHNQYVALLTEVGVVGLLLYIGFLAVAVWDAWRCEIPAVRTFALSLGVVLTIAGMASHNLFSDNGLAAMLGIAFGFLAGSKQLVRKQKLEKRRAHRRMASLPV